MLLQDLYRANLGWDQPLQGELPALWNELTESLRSKPISVPHYFKRDESSVKQIGLCRFRDASKAAYAAVVYLCFKSELRFMSSIVASENRVTPCRAYDSTIGVIVIVTFGVVNYYYS
uniref:Uncharacterized protein n=1 Tax=Amphimedon queenslandica TaxID=400682 RepID=A0A1X7VX62_AMPQE